ncbi:hypothetical protein [Pseudonocardia sp. GCM10023141]|uniref:hypothetical protein n=1 Tax=Pseudonocardia sp. GCM10023141 TaxID=3252653 RepID=UPI00360F1481
MTEPTCESHPGITADLRGLAAATLDRLTPVLEKITAEPADPTSTPSTCAVCPVCAVLATLRGERSELAVRLAEQLSGLLTVLRAALDEGDPVAAGRQPAPPEAAHPATNGRVVQHIHIDRPGRDR